MRRRRDHIVALTALGLVVSALLAGALFFRGPILTSWYMFRLRSAGPEEKWEQAAKFAASGGAARQAAEEWCIRLIEDWRPSETDLASRDPRTAVLGPAANKGLSKRIQNAQLVSFHYSDESSTVPAADLLASMKSLRAIQALAGALERSNPDLPFGGPEIPGGRSPPPAPILALHYTAGALCLIGEGSIPALVVALGSDKESVRVQAINALDWLEAADEKVLPAALRSLADPDRTVRYLARSYQNRFDPDGKTAIPILAEGLRVEHREAREECARTLVMLLGRNREAASALCGALTDASHPEIRGYLLQKLASDGERTISTPDLEPTLIDLLKDADPLIRRLAAYSIRRVGASSPAVIDALARALLEDPDRFVRHGAVMVLRDLAPASRPALGSIRAALEDEDGLVRRFAGYAMEKLGEE